MQPLARHACWLKAPPRQAAEDSWQLLGKGVPLERGVEQAVPCWLTDVADSGAKCLLDSQDLVHNFVGLQVASKAALACRAEGAPHWATHLQGGWQSQRTCMGGCLKSRIKYLLVRMGSRQGVPVQKASAMHGHGLVRPWCVVFKA